MSDYTSIVSSGAVRGAYRSSQSLAAERMPLPAEPERADAGSFSQIVREATQNAIETARQADTAMQQGLTGAVDTQSVVEATLALESTVKIAVAVRDKLVQAYQEVMRMPI